MGRALLTAETVPGYLRERQVAGAQDGGQVRVLDLSRRNHNLVVEIDGRPRWFVKQIQYATAEVVESLRREAHCYQTVERDETLAPLAALMPRCADFNAADSILVLEFLDGVNAADAHRRVGPFDARVARVAGELLGRLHGAAPLVVRSDVCDMLPGELPWVLRAHQGNDRAGGRARFLALFENDAATARALGGVRASWRRNVLIHGDARLENFILCRPVNAEAEFEARLVDWELADLGDAAWDCANAMQHYWTHWAVLRAPWDDLAAALDAFRDAYATARGLEAEACSDVFRRATLFTGARLIQTAYEQVAGAGRWSAEAQRTAWLARLLVVEPGRALEGLEHVHHAA
jgi:aminoglycoside phosphotransferase (APT) family kinase protein